MAKSSFFKDGGSSPTVSATIQSQVNAAAASAAAAANSFNSIGNELTLAQAARVGSETARDESVTAKVASEAARDTSNTKASEASTSAAASATSASNSQTAENNASTSSTASAASAAAALVSESNSAGSAVTASQQAAISTTQAGNAATSSAASSSAQTASETARDASVVAKTASETAKTASEAARDLALGYRDTAETHKNAAAVSAATATTQAALATTNGAAQVALATTQAGLATTNGQAQVALATTQVGLATTQAGIATTKATESSSSASNAATAQTAAESARDQALAAFDSFDDRFLGSKVTGGGVGDPTQDNDGNSLLSGALFYDETNNVMKVYTGSAWVAAFVSGGSFAALSGATFTGDVTVPNLITSGNVDGRDVSADGTKLDGVATGATAVSSLTDLSISDGTNGQALKTDGAGNFSFGDVASSTAFADVTGKPTTIAGYGITDAFDGNTSSLTGGNFSSSSNFQFLNGGNAQNVLARSVYAGTSYSAATANAGEMDALNGYRVAGGTVINNSRYLFHNGQYNYSDTSQYIWWTGQSYGNFRVAGGNVNGYSGIEFSDSAADSTFMVRNSDGLNGVYRADTGSWFYYWDSASNLASFGNVTAYASDERLKTNFKPIQSALEKVCSLDGIYYEWDKEACERTDFTPEFNKTELGFKAQQVQKYFPEVAVLAPFDTDPMGEGVNESKSGENYLTLHYERLVPALVEAIKELKAEVEELKSGCCGCQS